MHGLVCPQKKKKKTLKKIETFQMMSIERKEKEENADKTKKENQTGKFFWFPSKEHVNPHV